MINLSNISTLSPFNQSTLGNIEIESEHKLSAPCQREQVHEKRMIKESKRVAKLALSLQCNPHMAVSECIYIHKVNKI